jgi:hypothetical protein
MKVRPETDKGMNDWLRRVRRRSLAARLGVLGLWLAGLGAVVAPLAWFLQGGAGVGAAAAAWLVCAIGAALALAVTDFTQSPRRALWGLTAAAAARTGLPLVLGTVLYGRGGPLVEGGFLYYAVVFYSLALGVETVLSLPSAQPTAPCSTSRGPD